MNTANTWALGKETTLTGLGGEVERGSRGQGRWGGITLGEMSDVGSKG